jgi:hypothetical protein
MNRILVEIALEAALPFGKRSRSGKAGEELGNGTRRR